MVKIVLLVLLLVGCAIQSKPVPVKFCGAGETENCQPLGPGNKGGSTRGHSDDQHDKLMFYKAPEEIWPEDFKSTPQVCGSPFQGKLITR